MSCMWPEINKILFCSVLTKKAVTNIDILAALRAAFLLGGFWPRRFLSALIKQRQRIQRYLHNNYKHE